MSGVCSVHQGYDPGCEACSVGDYVADGIRQFKEADSRFEKLSDGKIKELYLEWSALTACAGWLVVTERGIASFIEWVFNSPYELARVEPVKDCPNCGCDQIHTAERIGWVHPFAKYCRNCRMYGPMADTEIAAVELWNDLPSGHEEGCTETDAKVLREANLALAEESERFRNAIEWALGESGSFPAAEGKTRYYWRAELRNRAGMGDKYKSIRRGR